MTPMEQSERKGLVERIPELRRLALAVHDPNEWASDTSHIELNAADRAYISALDPQTVLALLDLLSSDARPAPMAEEALATVTRIGEYYKDWDGDHADLKDAADTLSAHIDDLTRKVAEAERDRDRWFGNTIYEQRRATLAERALSRLQETDAVLAEREACLREFDVPVEFHPTGWPKHNALPHRTRTTAEVQAAIRSRPSPGPATETERKDGEALVDQYTDALRKAAYTEKAEDVEAAGEARRALLASVRPKVEGV